MLLMTRKGRNYILSSFSWLILLLGASYSQTDKLLQGQLLKDGDQLFSTFGKFRLGFFSPEGTKNRYLGIWYYRPKDRLNSICGCENYYGPSFDYPLASKLSYSNRPVWIANRNTPILDKSGSLIIDKTDGNLKILHKRGDPIAISMIQAAGNTSATLEKSGNFVLYEMYSNGSRRKLWQSFDYPTDTFLPGMKLGINLQTGHKWFLQSWIADDSPGQGSFTLGMDPNVTNRLIMQWDGEVIWRSGLWPNENPIFAYSNSYKFSYTTNEQEKYVSYSVNELVTSFPVLKLGTNGDLMDDEFSTVYSDLWRSGSCEGVFASFMPKSGFMSGEGFKSKEIDNMTLTHCEAKCFNNCSCAAYASTNMNNNTGCETWSIGTKFIESYSKNSRQIFIKEFLPKEPEKKMWPKLIIGGGVALVIPLLCFLCYRIRRKYKAKEEKWWQSLGVVLVLPLLCYFCYLIGRKLKAKVESMWNRWKLLHELGDNISVSLPIKFGKRKAQDKDQKHDLKIYDFQIIAAATNNFSTTNKLGQGGFGTVYKGKLLDGQQIAIKKLSKNSGQGVVEFKNEAKLIAKLQHTNLVRLLGCSLHGGERILVYEYMPNKSLDFFLFGIVSSNMSGLDSNRNNLLNLKKRLSIIEGVAQGLVYLHKYSRLKVIHRDLKASNILLDDQMNPKISDFGMAKAFGVNELEANTNRIVGTHGYMSPEYIMNGIVSMKTDVYSFGVMVLEIMSSKKNNGCYDTERPLNLVGYAWQLWNEGKGLELLHQTMDESCSANEVVRYLHVGLLCVQDRATDRPTMSEVVSMLANETMVLPAPKQPAFFINITSEEPEVSENRPENCSANNITISEMEAR